MITSHRLTNPSRETIMVQVIHKHLGYQKLTGTTLRYMYAPCFHPILGNCHLLMLMHNLTILHFYIPMSSQMPFSSFSTSFLTGPLPPSSHLLSPSFHFLLSQFKLFHFSARCKFPPPSQPLICISCLP